jgi:AmmeMemoRadiSam system protein B
MVIQAMANAPHPCPKLRPVESIFVPDRAHGRALLLRDTEGIAPSPVMIPGHFAAVVSRFNGARSIGQIAADASRAAGRSIREDVIIQLAEELDAACMLDTPWFRERRREVMGSFAAATVRRAAHAGGSYAADPEQLSRYIENECLAKARPEQPAGAMVGLCAPHMDLWRAAAGYGYAYRALRAAFHPDVDTFILLGTSHAGMRRPFAVCDKVFDTPLGPLDPAHDAIEELAAASRFDVREDQYLHKNEHSLEFQAVFLRHILGGRPATIVPILCGLCESQARGRDPSHDAEAESFIVALQRVVASRRGRVMIIAGADLAHIGPRFGDRHPLDARGQALLEERDRGSIALALARDASGFFADVVDDLSTRRVCGLGPIYTMLRALPASRGERLHYAQCVDPEEGSIVSHASFGFYA